MPPRPYLLSSETTAKGRESITRLSQTSGPPALAGGGSREVTRWKPLRGPSRHATKPLSFPGERAVPVRMHGVVPVTADARRCGPSGPANTEAVTWLILPVSKSCNKVSVGEPAEGSLSVLFSCQRNNYLPSLGTVAHFWAMVLGCPTCLLGSATSGCLSVDRLSAGWPWWLSAAVPYPWG